MVGSLQRHDDHFFKRGLELNLLAEASPILRRSNGGRMIGAASLDPPRGDDAPDGAATVDDLSSGRNANDHRRVGSIGGDDDRAGVGDESRCEREEGSVREDSASVVSLAPTSTDDSESSFPSYDGADAGEDDNENEICEKGQALGGTSRAESIPTGSIPASLWDTSPTLQAAPTDMESSDIRTSHQHFGRETGSCACPQDGPLDRSVSNDGPQAGLCSCLASTGESSGMDENDQDLMKASKLLSRLAEDSESENALELALQSTQTRGEFGDGKKCCEDTGEANTGIAATLEALGDLCGRMDSLSDPCQEMLKREVPPAIVRLLRLLTEQYAEGIRRVRHAHVTNSKELKPIQLKSQQQLVFLQACYALASLSFRSDSGTQSEIGRLGGVDAILAVMRWQSDDELIQQFACGALGNLLIDNESNAQLVHRAGGIGVIVMAMETHRSSVHLQEWALRTLNNLCHYESLRRHIVNAGGLSAIRDAARIAPVRPFTNETADNALCRTWAMDALAQAVESLEQ